jgi:type I restriction enzyme, S subunit
MALYLKPYGAYKDSGVQWLDAVPKHWKMVPNRALMKRRKELVGNQHIRHKLLSLTKQGVIIRDVESGKGKFSVDMSTFQEVRSGDLLFCLFDIPETPRTVGLSHYDGMITGAYTVFECSEPTLASFLEMFYRAMDDRKLLSPLYSGLRNTIPPSRFLGVKTPVPPAEEQAAIVRFINYADRRIRNYIRAKQQLVKVIEDQRQVIIHNAVSRGLSPSVRRKQDGIEWLGSVPTHWAIKRLKYVFREIDRRSTTGMEVLLSLRMRRGLVPHTEVSNIPIGPADLVGFKKVLPGQLVMNRMRAAIGMFGIAPQEGLVSPDYAVFEPIGAVDPEYFLQLFKTRSASTIFRIESKGLGTGSSGFMRLYTDRFGVIKVPVPPIDEQTAIVQAIAHETATINEEVEKIQNAVKLLRDYRTRLIADVVTGKLDVRDAAKVLPEEIMDRSPDAEPLEAAEAGEESDAVGIEVEPEEAEA